MTDNEQGYTPTTEEVRDQYAERPYEDGGGVMERVVRREVEFDRWLSTTLAAHRVTLAAVIEKAMSVAARENDVVLYRILSTAPSSVLAAHDAKVRAEALREAADDYRQQALPVNSELSMLGGAGPFVDKGIEGYMEAQHDAWDWLRARADKEENR